MSMEFSRRSFLKLSALTAVAVAGAGLVSGCSLTNPNQPVGFVGDTLAVMGKHTLTDPQFNGTDLTCKVNVACTSVNALTVIADHFALIVTDAEGNETEYNNFGNTDDVSISEGTFTLKKGDDFDTEVTISGVTISDTDTVKLRYYPRLYAYIANDNYNDVYATWILQSPSKNIYEIEGITPPANSGSGSSNSSGSSVSSNPSGSGVASDTETR